MSSIKNRTSPREGEFTDKNLFFVFEGIDGSGKTTLSKLVADKIRSQNKQVILHREPTNGLYGKQIRAFLSGQISLSPSEQLDLFLKDRNESVETVIKPNILQGNIIIQDRYIYSTAAYQGGKAHSCEDILRINFEHGFPKPKQIFFLDLTPEEANERRIQRGGKQEVFDDDLVQNLIYQNYMKILPENTVFLDATQSIEALVEGVLACIELE